MKDLRLKLRHLSNLTSSQAVPPKLLFRFYEQIVIIVRIPEPNKSHPSRSEWAGKTVLLPNRYLPSLSTLPSQPPVPGHLTFLPGKDQFHNFFGILLPPEPITDVAVMAAKLLIFRLALKFFSAKHTLMLVKKRMVFHPQSAALIRTINPFSSGGLLL